MDKTSQKRRANVILELIKSERDFVKNLRDVTEGYLQPARRHPEIFTAERINTIFSNIEQLYEFQCKFLASLESCINWTDPAASEVGRCFLEHQNGFAVYYYYCNNHPNAISELQELCSEQKFVRFFEACRLLQNMIDISLDGFLLTPIQKICKYPLQLNELLKYTSEDHPDFQFVQEALECVRNCANLANERKRRIEALADIMLFQEKFDNWYGPKLSETSSILIHSGEVSKMTSHNWSQGVQLHLFDHLLLYSKKDLLKRNTLILRGRICMDTVTEILEAEESKTKKGFKIYDCEQQKWFVFAIKSEKEKDDWLNAFERERELVEADEEEGFQITKKEIGVARRALNSRKHSRSARYRSKKPDTAVVDQLDIDEATTIMNRTLSLPSCIHPSHVMNFVQDSKVVSSTRGSSSPTTCNSNQSPTDNSSVNQSSISTNTSSSATGWFKKVGSRRLSSKQVDETEIKLQSSSSEMTYDQLQKRHETIMLCAERARLYRLNNNLPPLDPKMITNCNFGAFQMTTNNQQQRNPNTIARPIAAARRDPNKNRVDHQIGQQVVEISTNMHSLNIQGTNNLASTPKITTTQPDGSGSSIEKTVLLSSGRVVRVRENAV